MRAAHKTSQGGTEKTQVIISTVFTRNPKATCQSSVLAALVPTIDMVPVAAGWHAGTAAVEVGCTMRTSTSLHNDFRNLRLAAFPESTAKESELCWQPRRLQNRRYYQSKPSLLFLLTLLLLKVSKLFASTCQRASRAALTRKCAAGPATKGGEKDNMPPRPDASKATLFQL